GVLPAQPLAAASGLAWRPSDLMGPAPTHKMVIDSKLAEAAKVVHAILRDAESCGYGENARFAIRLALDEALSNAIRHGNRFASDKHVTVEYRASPEEVEISIADEGPGFHPRNVPDPTLDENLDRPNGRGVML